MSAQSAIAATVHSLAGCAPSGRKLHSINGADLRVTAAKLPSLARTI